MEPISLTRQTYEVIAESFEEHCRTPTGDLVTDAAEFARDVPCGWVLDIGCGPGRDIRQLRAHGLPVVGIDLSTAMLRSGGVPGTVCADMRELPIASGSAAGAWCQASLLHIPHEQVPRVLAEIARVCIVGARLHLAVLEGDGEAIEPNAHGTRLPRYFAYHRADPLRELLDAAGFHVTNVQRRQHERRWLRFSAFRREVP